MYAQYSRNVQDDCSMYTMYLHCSQITSDVHNIFISTMYAHFRIIRCSR